MPKAKKARYALYAVAKGRKGPGVFATWKEAQPHTVKVSGAKYKGFDTLDEVKEYFQEEKVDIGHVFWGEGTRSPGNDAPPDAQPHVVAQPATQGVAVAVALYASGGQSSSQSSGMAEAASAAMARAVEVLSHDAPRAASEPAPATDPLDADKELPPLPPSSQPTQDTDDAASARAASEPPRERRALLRARSQLEVMLTALGSPNGDGTSAPEVPNAVFAETVRNILKDVDDGLRTDPQDGAVPN